MGVLEFSKRAFPTHCGRTPMSRILYRKNRRSSGLGRVGQVDPKNSRDHQALRTYSLVGGKSKGRALEVPRPSGFLRIPGRGLLPIFRLGLSETDTGMGKSTTREVGSPALRPKLSKQSSQRKTAPPTFGGLWTATDKHGKKAGCHKSWWNICSRQPRNLVLKDPSPLAPRSK